MEDNDDLREMICALLERDDREVVTAASAELALEAVAARSFDILMTDVSLPGLSGIDLARRLLATEPTQWIVLCSGYDFRHGLQELGPNVRSLPKPFEVEELDALLDEIAATLRGPVPAG